MDENTVGVIVTTVLLFASELLPFFDTEANGLLHVFSLVLRRIALRSNNEKVYEGRIKNGSSIELPGVTTPKENDDDS